MIGYVVDALVDLVLLPQGAVADPLLRALTDVTDTPIDVASAELNVSSASSLPVSRAMGTVAVQHTITVDVVTVDGDLVRAQARRDSITTDLVLRFEADKTLGAAASPDGKEYLYAGDWRVEYLPGVVQLGESDTLGSLATVTFVLTAERTR